MKNKKPPKKLEFSKLIFLCVSAVTLLVTGFALYMIVVTRDTTALAYLIPAVFAEMASATGFYYSKAKAENKIKLMREQKTSPGGKMPEKEMEETEEAEGAENDEFGGGNRI